MKKLLLFSMFALLASAMGWATTETWVKVTSQEDLTDGDYLIVCESKSKAFDGSASTIVAKNTPVDVTISSNTISLDDKYCFTIKETTTSGQYSITSKSGLQIGTNSSASASGGEIKTGTYTNSLSIDQSGNAIIKSSTGRQLMYNTSNPRFCYYKSSTQNMGSIALYKKQEAPATKVADVTVSPAFGDIAKGTQVTISCATEGAVLDGYVGETDVKGKGFPYTFTANEVGKIEVGV